MAKDSIFYSSKSLKKGKEQPSLDQALVMGILNCTPDSFFADSRVDLYGVLDKAEQMLSHGASILDIGGFSTRPGANQVTVEEEIQRVIPVIECLKKNFPQAKISIDTFRASVAEKALQAGAEIINDIGGGTLDNEMFNLLGKTPVPYVLGHIQGHPSNMQNNPVYEDVVTEILSWFSSQIEVLRAKGFEQIILDPGIGFGKTIEHNFSILSRLNEFKQFGLPVMIGISRKSFIYKTLSITPEESLAATTALHWHCLQGGVQILRVHDVKETVEIVKIHQALRAASETV